MVQIRQATARLRLLLAEIRGREDQLDNTIRQFRTQLSRLPRQAIYERTSLDMALSAMAEVEERLNHAQVTRQHLLAIKEKASDELSALELTQQVEEAKETLGSLKRRESFAEREDIGLSAKIRHLEKFIADHSKKAERAITSSFEEEGA
jgi:chromosome segregation ATPase